jgi:hypothetical protein
MLRAVRTVWLLRLPLVPLRGQDPVRRDIDFDHVILATPRLAWGIEEFARLTGIVPRRGGQHPGRGTENALVGLGAGHYLELLAPITPSGADSSVPRLRPVGWALRTEALSALLTRVRAAGFELLGPVPGSRRTPDGTLLEWRTAATGGSGLELAPFFIEWTRGTPHPSTTSPAGCRLVSFETVVPDTARLQGFFRASGYEAIVHSGTTAGFRLILDCPRGRAVFAT